MNSLRLSLGVTWKSLPPNSNLVKKLQLRITQHWRKYEHFLRRAFPADYFSNFSCLQERKLCDLGIKPRVPRSLQTVEQVWASMCQQCWVPVELALSRPELQAAESRGNSGGNTAAGVDERSWHFLLGVSKTLSQTKLIKFWSVSLTSHEVKVGLGFLIVFFAFWTGLLEACWIARNTGQPFDFQWIQEPETRRFLTDSTVNSKHGSRDRKLCVY